MWYILILDCVPFQIVPNWKKKKKKVTEDYYNSLLGFGNYQEEILHRDKDFTMTHAINIETSCRK